MHRCTFPLAPSTLLKRNENLGIKDENGQFDFQLGGITFKSTDDVSSTKFRITLQHKVTGEILTFDDTRTLSFLPDIEKLKAKESGSHKAVSRADLIRTYGSSKDQKFLREQEKLNINKEAQNVIKTATRDALKNEKVEAAKGNKMEVSYMDVTMNGNTDITSMANLIDEDHNMRLSSIAPKEVLDSLKSEAESVIGLTINEIGKLTSSLSFHHSVLDLIKTWPCLELHKMQLAILLEYFIRFLNLPIKTIRSKEPLLGCPGITTKFIFRNFTRETFQDGGKSTITMPKEEKDKLFLIIIGLYGYLSNYEFSVSKFMVDTKSGRDRIKKIGQIINMRLILLNKEYYMKSLKPYMIDTGIN